MFGLLEDMWLFVQSICKILLDTVQNSRGLRWKAVHFVNKDFKISYGPGLYEKLQASFHVQKYFKS